MTSKLWLCLALLQWFAYANAILTKWEATNFCKCICFQSNYTILHLDLPDNPSQPCLTCTKNWCLNQNLPICAGAALGIFVLLYDSPASKGGSTGDTDLDTATGKEGDIEARCFQRDSPRDQLVVTLFLLCVFGLLLGAGIKNRMIRAGFDPHLPIDAGRRWWHAFSPRRQFEERFGYNVVHAEQEMPLDDYPPVSADPQSRL